LGANKRVERSLYERANGYNYEAVKIFMPADAKQPVVVHYVEHTPPDVTAGIFWLCGWQALGCAHFHADDGDAAQPLLRKPLHQIEAYRARN
jgi:hypothetical protein